MCFLVQKQLFPQKQSQNEPNSKPKRTQFKAKQSQTAKQPKSTYTLYWQSVMKKSDYLSEMKTLPAEASAKAGNPKFIRRPVRRSFSEDGSLSEGECCLLSTVYCLLSYMTELSENKYNRNVCRGLTELKTGRVYPLNLRCLSFRLLWFLRGCYLCFPARARWNRVPVCRMFPWEALWFFRVCPPGLY